MLSVEEAAKQLGVSAARVRALAKSGQLPARKIGRAWAFREEDVMQRVISKPTSGRPVRKTGGRHDSQLSEDARGYECDSACREPGAFGDKSAFPSSDATQAHEAYLACRKLFSVLPSAEVMANAQSQEEASFYMSVTEFFLRQKQYDLIKRGVF